MRAVLLALVCLLAGCGVELEHGLDEQQANEIAATLETAGISADKLSDPARNDAYTVVVPRGELARAVALLRARDLPRRPGRGLADTFGGSSLLPTPVEERARYTAALATELERSLRELGGVVAARVHLSLAPDELGGNPPARPASASVLLKTTRPLPLPEADVRRLVAGAVPGLQVAGVTVVVTETPGHEAPARPFERVGPIRVARESRTLAATLAASGLVAVLLLSLGLVFSTFRVGQLRRRVRDLELSQRL